MERTLAADIPTKVGELVRVAGWVHVRRDHGKLIFIDLRDRSGILQVVFGPEHSEKASQLRPEWVIEIEGTINARPEKMVNPNIQTGKVELKAERLTVLNEAETPPFDVTDDGYGVSEEVRLAYRYVDLRRERLQNTMRLRSRFVDLCRQFLFTRDFTEIETPYLTKATPEGARDFVVPSRHYPGNFFALPQSPQQYKQLLMVGGAERYFQTARAFRDEDLRADRGYEHTQLDIEISFATHEEILDICEQMVTTVLKTLGYSISKTPFPRLSYSDAIRKFGTDAPDLRTDREKANGTLALCWIVDFPFFEKTNDGGWTFTHNPFSASLPEHEPWLRAGEHIGDIVAQQYDLVCNGHEIGGGSIRNHRPELLRAVFRIMGYDDSEIDKQFGHMLAAFSSGAPPHGGIAFGIERIIMELARETTIREVQAFPQTSSGRTAVMDAPSPLNPAQLEELGIEIKDKKK